MQQELLKRARECRFLRGALLDLAAVLPPNDNELDWLIGQAVEERDNDAFVRLVFAALGAGRRVDARHLEGGASLFDDPQQLAAAAMHVSGDEVGAERNATALLLAGLWCKENANAAFPPELIVQARIHARRAGYNLLADIPIFVLCHLLQDEGLTELLRSKAIPPPSDAAAAEFISLLVGPFRQSALPVIPERPGPVVHSGYTMRRAVARIGRNDQCPCGSGKSTKSAALKKTRNGFSHHLP
ncbi:MAG: hypothetical protein DMG14_29645 [Acidobacteria bacterium]|nr:MAG: hypothetical protein DMG14_29645 [Acidobacteriota bacterium]